MVVGRQILSRLSSQPPDEVPMILLWMTAGICIPWLLDPSYLSISSFQYTGHHLQWQRSMLQNQSQCSGEWYIVRSGHMLWRNPLIHPRLPCSGSFTCNSRPRMVSGMLVRREELTEGRFWVSEGWLYLTHVDLNRSQLNCCASLHSHLWERPPVLLREHLLYDKDRDNTSPVAITVPDDMFLGKLGPIIWL